MRKREENQQMKQLVMETTILKGSEVAKQRY